MSFPDAITQARQVVVLRCIKAEIHRRIRRTRAKVRLKQRELKFQDERIHKAKLATLMEINQFITELECEKPEGWK